MMIRIAACILLLAAIAQGASSNWENLSRLQKGDTVAVEQSDGQATVGQFVRYSSDTITVISGTAESSIERPKIHQITVRSKSKRLRNALIGVGVGLAVSLVVDRTVGGYLNNEVGYQDSARAAVWLIPPALFGGLAAIPASHPVVYRSKR